MPDAGARRRLGGALLLLLGLTGGLSAQAADLQLPPSPEARPAASAGAGGHDAGSAHLAAVPAVHPLAQLSQVPQIPEVPRLPQVAALAPTAPIVPTAAPLALSTASAEDGCYLPANGASPTSEAAAGLPAGAFASFSDGLATAAEPSAASATPAIAGASDASLGGAEPAAAAPPAAAPPPPPQPPLGFDRSFGVPQTRFGKLIYQTASRYALNPLLVAAMIRVESDFNPRAKSRKGACGLMQVLPSTARRFGVQRRRDLFNPRKNLEVAGRYLRWLVDRFGEDPVRVLAAYNAGEGAVDRFGGVPPFSETRDYVQRIFTHLGFTALLDLPVAAVAIAAGTK